MSKISKFQEDIRNLDTVQWKDSDAWMEKMKGPKWNNAIKEEDELVETYTNIKDVQLIKKSAISIFNKVKDNNPIGYTFFVGSIAIQWQSAFFLSWHWLGSKDKNEARDVFSDIDGGTWVTKDVGSGSEKMRLEFYKEPYQTSPTWSINDVGGEFAILGRKCFYLGVVNKLWYNTLWMCDAKTGRSKICLYEEKNPNISLSLQRQPNRRLIFSREMNQEYWYYTLSESGKLEQIHHQFSIPQNWMLPLGSYGIDFVWKEKGYMITKQHGKKTLWWFSNEGIPKEVISIPGGNILIDPWAAWENRFPCTVRIDHPADGISSWVLEGKKLSSLQKEPSYGLKFRRSSTVSYDGTTVHTLAVFKKKPTKLIVIGYGAYGIPTGFGAVMHRWGPLLEMGWCVACVFIRGGGDHTAEWGKAGRRGGRKFTFADFESGIRSLQHEMSIDSSKTAIYGRSAGGLLVGHTLSENTNGKLMSCVYTEVPYVDVLRTTTNPTLPLTRLEYNEFGNPKERIEDLIDVALMSPADAATVIKTPDIFVLARTAIHDSQVFSYESLKWIRRLRTNSPTGAPKLLLMEKDQGHFTPPESQIEQFSIDLALLESWMEKKLPYMR